MIEVSSANRSNILSRCSVIGTFAVSVEKHCTLNSCCGVIFQALLHLTNEEILEHLKSQNVTEVRWITIRRNGYILPTKHIITFNSPVLLKKIKAAYLSCSVRPYIPNPLQCFQCQRYRHCKTSCYGSVAWLAVQKSAMTTWIVINPNAVSTVKETIKHFQDYVLNGFLRNKFKLWETTNNISHSKACKHVECKTHSLWILYSNVVKSGLKSDASTQTFTSCAATLQKSSCLVGITCKTRNMPELNTLTPFITAYYYWILYITRKELSNFNTFY